MNKIEEIYALRDKDWKQYIKIQIGNVRLTVRQPYYVHAISDRDELDGYSEVVLLLPDLKQKVFVAVGDEIHDNKLEVLKSEFDYDYRKI